VIEACKSGYHLCRREDLLSWLGPAIWEAEADEEGMIVADDKIIVHRARLIRRIDTWSERTARLFAADCAEFVLPNFESRCPNDDRARLAIQASRDYANGKIDSAAWSAADSAADWAADSAAESAARQWQTDRLFQYLNGEVGFS